MFHITTSLDAIAYAEKISISAILTEEEKSILLTTLLDTIAVDLACLPPHAKVASAAISRMIDNEQRNPTSGTKAQKQGRKAKGIEDSAQVDAGRPEEGPEAPEGKTEGFTPAKDAGSPNRTEPLAEARACSS